MAEIHPLVRIGHVHLKVADLDRALQFYWDRPEDQWPRTPDGRLAMFTRRLDLDALLRAGTASSAEAPGPGPRDL